MHIKPEEIDTVKTIGHINKEEVKLIRTKGGFYVGVGKKNNSKTPEILAAGSHPALVCFQIEKTHGSNFHPSLNKSELDNFSFIEKNEYLSSKCQKTANCLIIKNDIKEEILIENNGVVIAKAEIEEINGYLRASNVSFNLPSAQEIYNVINNIAKERNLGVEI